MWLCVCVFMYVCVCVAVSVSVHACLCFCVCVPVCLCCVCICVCFYMCVALCLYLCVCLFLCMCLFVCFYMCVSVCWYNIYGMYNSSHLTEKNSIEYVLKYVNRAEQTLSPLPCHLTISIVARPCPQLQQTSSIPFPGDSFSICTFVLLFVQVIPFFK